MTILAAWAGQSPIRAATVNAPPIPSASSYADLADLADSTPLVIRAEVRKLAKVEPERARGTRTGWGRFYVEARTKALLTGSSALGEALRYLVDLPLDARGNPPKIKKQQVLIFARPVPSRPGELQLVAPDAQIVWSAETEARLRTVLTQLSAPDAPRQVAGVREAIHVPGTLAGAGETQFFLETADQSAASITVQHAQGGPASWGVSFSEVAAVTDARPLPDTLGWYRLACFLPNALPAGSNLSETPAARAQADADYRMVLGELGPCPRTRR